jgi:hypothetical protein
MESVFMDRSTWKEDNEDAHKEEGAATCEADYYAQLWNRSGLFNWYCTFSFNQHAHWGQRLHKPTALHDFVERELRDFGYRGPFVIVAHDNSGTRYYHAHCLLADYEPGICADLTDHFSKFGNVSKKDDGPIRGMGAFWYCANRAHARTYDEPMASESLKWARKPRKRGRGRGRHSRRTGHTEFAASEVA